MDQKDKKVEKKNFIARILEAARIMAIKSANEKVNKEIKKRANY